MAENPKSQKQYPLKFDGDSDIGRWMKEQQNKSRSLGYLIRWAITNFGEVDLIDAAMQSTLNTLPTSQNQSKDVVPQQTQPNVAESPKETNPTPQSSAPKVRTNNQPEYKSHNRIDPVIKSKKPDILSNML